MGDTEHTEEAKEEEKRGDMGPRRIHPNQVNGQRPINEGWTPERNIGWLCVPESHGSVSRSIDTNDKNDKNDTEDKKAFQWGATR